MMGAAVYPASEQIYFEKSFEYLHKPRRMGAPMGEFKNYGFPCGEFCYKDLEKGFKVIAKYALPNIIRILFENKEPILEEENIIPLI